MTDAQLEYGCYPIYSLSYDEDLSCLRMKDKLIEHGSSNFYV